MQAGFAFVPKSDSAVSQTEVWPIRQRADAGWQSDLAGVHTKGGRYENPFRLFASLVVSKYDRLLVALICEESNKRAMRPIGPQRQADSCS